MILSEIIKKEVSAHLFYIYNFSLPLFSHFSAPPKLVSQEQLMRLARKMGKNWKEIGILFLRMDISRLEQFQEEHSKNVVMQIFSMLWAWRTREKDKATADRLYNILSQEGVELDSSAYAFLLE